MTPRILLALLALVPLPLLAQGRRPVAPAGTAGIAQIDTFTALSAGTSTHTCVLTTGGAAYCWGDNSYGQLGDGSTTIRRTPVAVAGGVTFASLTAGINHTCGLTTGGATYCWGWNHHGQLGDGTTSNSPIPVAVPGSFVFQAISAGQAHTCGLTSGGAAYCWGWNRFGQLGDGTTIDRSIPVAVSGGLVFQAISAGSGGAGEFTCGLTTGGAAFCWGWNQLGQLGDGTTSDRSIPVAVSGGLVFKAISSANLWHACGLTTGGAAYCWGSNYYAQLGDGTTSRRKSPVAVSGGLIFQAISAGDYHTCGLTTGGAAYCWGENGEGQGGDGTAGGKRRSPVAVSGGLVFKAISLGFRHTCGLTTGGAAYCWGRNGFGELGNGSNIDSPAPVAVVNP